MKIVVDINHPAQVHFFKNFIIKEQELGNEIQVYASKKDVAFTLLEKYGIKHEKLSAYGDTITQKMANIPKLDLEMFLKVRKFHPDIFIGAGSVRAAHVSKMLGKKYVAFTDTEHSREQYMLYAPFSDVVYTPSCFTRDLGKKQIRYEGYKELAYLHPNYFKPNNQILKKYGINKDEKYIVVRLVSWNASHDIGQHGILEPVKSLEKLEKYGRVLLTSEGKLDEKLKKYALNISPEDMHDILYYAQLYIGEGATMATESAIMGTPSIYVSTLSGKMGNLIELESKYKLLYSYKKMDEAIMKADELGDIENVKNIWRERREQLLKDKIDVTKLMIDAVKKYDI